MELDNRSGFLFKGISTDSFPSRMNMIEKTAVVAFWTGVILIAVASVIILPLVAATSHVLCLLRGKG
jgi:hypothetical protein